MFNWIMTIANKINEEEWAALDKSSSFTSLGIYLGTSLIKWIASFPNCFRASPVSLETKSAGFFTSIFARAKLYAEI